MRRLPTSAPKCAGCSSGQRSEWRRTSRVLAIRNVIGWTLSERSVAAGLCTGPWSRPDTTLAALV